jgi:hypothetical protein
MALPFLWAILFLMDVNLTKMERRFAQIVTGRLCVSSHALFTAALETGTLRALLCPDVTQLIVPIPVAEPFSSEAERRT